MSTTATRTHGTHATPATPPTDRPRVDFIGIGVQKSATAWLFRCVAEHPEIGIGRVGGGTGANKEINFFNQNYEKGFGWYDRLFDPARPHNFEFSTLYFHDRNVPERIRRYNPEARLLLSLRNPIDRAFSQHKHEIRRGRLPPDRHGFRLALAQNPSYVEQGLYATHLQRWLEFFPRDRIHVVLHEEILERPAEVLAGIFEFVGVDPTFRPARTGERINESITVRSARIERGLRLASRWTHRALGPTLHRTLKATGLPGRIRERNRVAIEGAVVPPLTAADRAELLDLFRDEIARLGEILGRDLSHWR